jgi:hypothetical protein
MNNSDNRDFQNWQNGDDENDPRNPNNWNPGGGFFYYGPSENFKKMFNNNNPEEFFENMKEYLNMDDMLNQWSKQMNQKPSPRRNQKSKNMPQKTTMFSQEDYMKLIEIRGYLNITGQIAHVRALDKVINQIIIIPKDPK